MHFLYVQGCGRVYSRLEVSVSDHSSTHACLSAASTEPPRNVLYVRCKDTALRLQDCLGENNRDWRLCQKGTPATDCPDC